MLEIGLLMLVGIRGDTSTRAFVAVGQAAAQHCAEFEISFAASATVVCGVLVKEWVQCDGSPKDAERNLTIVSPVCA
jgi:hypothetical protein